MKGKISIIFLACMSSLLFAKAPDEGEFKAANLIADDIAKWIVSVKPQIKSLAIFAVQSRAPLDQEYSDVLETEVLKSLAKLEFRNASSCKECRTPMIAVQEEKLVITKGPFNQEMIQKIGKNSTAETFLVLDVYRGSFSIIAQAAVYENPSGAVLASERFSATAVSFSESSVQFLLSFGLGKVIMGKNPADLSFAMTANISLLEEIGFAKGGVNIGGSLANTNGMMVYADPTLAFRGKFGNSGLGWAFWIGAGYGFTSEAKGLVFRAAYEVFVSSLAVIGVEGVYLIPDSTVPTLKSVVGLHIGISLGR
jgi:hypothetical protein